MDNNSIKIILERFLRKENLMKRIEDEEIIFQFKKIIGSNLVKYIDKAKFKDGVIYLKLTSSVLKNEILYEKTKIIEKINTKMRKRKVKEIKFE